MKYYHVILSHEQTHAASQISEVRLVLKIILHGAVLASIVAANKQLFQASGQIKT